MNLQCLLIALFASGCASALQSLPDEHIQTFILTQTGLKHKTATAEIDLTFQEALYYRCYSPSDDLIIRNRLSTLESMGSAK